MTENLMDGLLSEMNRVREIIKEYEHPALKGAGNIAAYMMKMDIANAEKCIGEGDTIQMLVSYSKLKEYSN